MYITHILRDARPAARLLHSAPSPHLLLHADGNSRVVKRFANGRPFATRGGGHAALSGMCTARKTYKIQLLQNYSPKIIKISIFKNFARVHVLPPSPRPSGATHALRRCERRALSPHYQNPSPFPTAAAVESLALPPVAARRFPRPSVRTYSRYKRVDDAATAVATDAFIVAERDRTGANLRLV